MKKKLAIMSLVLIAVLAMGTCVYAGPGGAPLETKSITIPNKPALDKTIYHIAE